MTLPSFANDQKSIFAIVDTVLPQDREQQDLYVTFEAQGGLPFLYGSARLQLDERRPVRHSLAVLITRSPRSNGPAQAGPFSFSLRMPGPRGQKKAGPPTCAGDPAK